MRSPDTTPPPEEPDGRPITEEPEKMLNDEGAREAPRPETPFERGFHEAKLRRRREREGLSVSETQELNETGSIS